MKDQMQAYLDAYNAGDLEKAQKLLEKSDLKKDKKSELLWHLEKGTLALTQNDEDTAIVELQAAIDLIDKLFTTKLSSKAASLLINDASDEFYGSSYERSYAYYFLAKAYYSRYLKKQNKLDLQGARGTILAWDSYFSELQRSASYKTLYHTDLMLKVFGGQIHEVSDIRNDKQISLQLYKDSLNILEREGGIFALFNKKNIQYIEAYEKAIKEGVAPSEKLYEKTNAYDDLKSYLHYKILVLTKEIRGFDFALQKKTLNASSEVISRVETQKPNVVLVLEEGLIPAKVGRPFNFGIKGAMNSVDNSGAKKFIATVGVEFITQFAMNKLGMMPTQTTNPGSFIFAHDMTKLAVQEAAIEFELPMIANVPPVQRLQLYVLNEKNEVVSKASLPVISENGDIARVVLEEDVVARYTKTGTRIAIKHILAIIAALEVYQGINKTSQNEFIAKTAAMATYVGASKGIAAMEKADTRYWSTLPQALRMTELSLSPGKYKVGIASFSGTTSPNGPEKMIGEIQVSTQNKTIFMMKF
ncbi:MAG: hypothetical protein AB7I27_16260 [Bacteriovoracaceae bacterium]